MTILSSIIIGVGVDFAVHYISIFRYKTKRVTKLKTISINIKKKEKHSIENTGNSRLEIIEIQSGLKLIEEDIVRLHDIYGRK